MNRRQALAALASLPAVASIEVARVAPEDVIVVNCDEHLSAKAVGRIAATMQQIWPGQKVAVLGKGMTLKIARSASP